MTGIYQYLLTLPMDKKKLFTPIFDSVDRFYAATYLIARNEHVTEQSKPDRYEELLILRDVKRRLEKLLDSYGFDGKEIVADIASDYLDDFVNYQELEPDLTNEEFHSIIEHISLAVRKI